MNYHQILRYQPWLRLVDINRISSRFLEYSRGDLFVVFDTVKQKYELHSVRSFMLTGYSYNATFDQNQINGGLLDEFKSNNNKAFSFERESQRMKTEYMYDKWDKTRFDTEEQMKTLYRALGVKL